MLAGISAVWDAETKIEVEALQEMVAEVVPFDHAEVDQGSVPDCEFHPNWKEVQHKEEGAEV